MRESLTYFVLTVLICYVKLGSTQSVLGDISAGLQENLKNLTSSLIGIKGLSFQEMAVKYGHPAEEHEVTTEDGYKLTVFHLPGKKKGLPVLLFHGIADSADTWIIRGNTSLSITLVNRGQDVWLGNNRGNRYARGHTNFSTSDPRYWNFSFHEIGIYDLAATIDLVLNKTGAKKLNFFGHSQGNTILYVLLSVRPEYNDKINVGTALAPICYVQNLPPPVGTLFAIANLIPDLYQLTQLLGITNVFGDNSIETTLIRIISQIPVIGYLIFADLILFQLTGYDTAELEPAFLPTVGLHFPTWTAVKDLLHYSQIANSKVFAQFDYGPAGNQIMYNSSTPAKYDLSKVKAKIVLLVGLNDKFTPLSDVALLRSQLPNKQYTVIPRRLMNHIDFVWGLNMPVYLYNYIYNILDT